MYVNLFKNIKLLILLTCYSVISFASDDFPTKPITYIIPFNPGGESDISARFQQKYWNEVTGQDVIIKYQAGAGGAQAWSQINELGSDGHTIMGVNLPHVVLQPMQGSSGYKTEDLKIVNYFHYTPNAILVHKDSEFNTLEDLISFAKGNPGMLTISGSGTNSANHLAQVEFNTKADVITTYIPFSGTAPSTTALLGNQVMASFGYLSTKVNYDELKILALATEERVSSFPDIPTFKEQGFDIVGGAYRGLAMPLSTPLEIQEKVSGFISTINNKPEFAEAMEKSGFVLIDITLDKVNAFMQEQFESYYESAKALGIVE